ncbi:MAG: hypothetical protein KDD56_04505 [Bdellovibrionales bacterium]|nr:hypothetical protein [Bdellovibrionales bacterium]
MKRILKIISVIVFAIGCNSSEAAKDKAYEGGESKRGVVSTYVNKPLEDAREVQKQADERNQKMKEQLDFE